MRTVQITAAAQLELMESLACLSGSSSYEVVRSEMHDALKADHPGCDIELDNIEPQDMQRFKAWLELEDE